MDIVESLQEGNDTYHPKPSSQAQAYAKAQQQANQDADYAGEVDISPEQFNEVASQEEGGLAKGEPMLNSFVHVHDGGSCPWGLWPPFTGLHRQRESKDVASMRKRASEDVTSTQDIHYHR